MKLKKKHKDLYRFYLRMGQKNKEGVFFGKKAAQMPRVGEESAMKAYHIYESTGEMVPCASPILFKTIESGKALTKLTIDNWMSDLEIGLILFKFEVEEYVEDWPPSERQNVLTRMSKVSYGSKFSDAFRVLF